MNEDTVRIIGEDDTSLLDLPPRTRKNLVQRTKEGIFMSNTEDSTIVEATATLNELKSQFEAGRSGRATPMSGAAAAGRSRPGTGLSTATTAMSWSRPASGAAPVIQQNKGRKPLEITDGTTTGMVPDPDEQYSEGIRSSSMDRSISPPQQRAQYQPVSKTNHPSRRSPTDSHMRPTKASVNRFGVEKMRRYQPQEVESYRLHMETLGEDEVPKIEENGKGKNETRCLDSKRSLSDDRKRGVEWLSYWGQLQKLKETNKELLDELEYEGSDTQRLSAECENYKQRFEGAAKDVGDLSETLENERAHSNKVLTTEKNKYAALLAENERLISKTNEMRRQVTLAENAMHKLRTDTDGALRTAAKAKKDLEDHRMQHAIEVVKLKHEVNSRNTMDSEKEVRLIYLEDETSRQTDHIRTLSKTVELLTEENKTLQDRVQSLSTDVPKAQQRSLAGADATSLQQLTQKSFQKRENDLLNQLTTTRKENDNNKFMLAGLKKHYESVVHQYEVEMMLLNDINAHTGAPFQMPKRGAPLLNAASGAGGRKKSKGPTKYTCGAFTFPKATGEQEDMKQFGTKVPTSKYSDQMDNYRNQMWTYTNEIIESMAEACKTLWEPLNGRIPADTRQRPEGEKESIHYTAQTHLNAAARVVKNLVQGHMVSMEKWLDMEQQLAKEAEDKLINIQRTESQRVNVFESKLREKELRVMTLEASAEKDQEEKDATLHNVKVAIDHLGERGEALIKDVDLPLSAVGRSELPADFFDKDGEAETAAVLKTVVVRMDTLFEAVKLGMATKSAAGKESHAASDMIINKQKEQIEKLQKSVDEVQSSNDELRETLQQMTANMAKRSSTTASPPAGAQVDPSSGTAAAAIHQHGGDSVAASNTTANKPEPKTSTRPGSSSVAAGSKQSNTLPSINKNNNGTSSSSGLKRQTSTTKSAGTGKKKIGTSSTPSTAKPSRSNSLVSIDTTSLQQQSTTAAPPQDDDLMPQRQPPAVAGDVGEAVTTKNVIPIEGQTLAESATIGLPDTPSGSRVGERGNSPSAVQQASAPQQESSPPSRSVSPTPSQQEQQPSQPIVAHSALTTKAPPMKQQYPGQPLSLAQHEAAQSSLSSNRDNSHWGSAAAGKRGGIKQRSTSPVPQQQSKTPQRSPRMVMQEGETLSQWQSNSPEGIQQGAPTTGGSGTTSKTGTPQDQELSSARPELGDSTASATLLHQSMGSATSSTTNNKNARVGSAAVSRVGSRSTNNKRDNGPKYQQQQPQPLMGIVGNTTKPQQQGVGVTNLLQKSRTQRATSATPTASSVKQGSENPAAGFPRASSAQDGHYRFQQEHRAEHLQLGGDSLARGGSYHRPSVTGKMMIPSPRPSSPSTRRSVSQSPRDTQLGEDAAVVELPQHLQQRPARNDQHSNVVNPLWRTDDNSGGYLGGTGASSWSGHDRRGSGAVHVSQLTFGSQPNMQQQYVRVSPSRGEQRMRALEDLANHRRQSPNQQRVSPNQWSSSGGQQRISPFRQQSPNFYAGGGTSPLRTAAGAGVSHQLLGMSTSGNSSSGSGQQRTNLRRGTGNLSRSTAMAGSSGYTSKVVQPSSYFNTSSNVASKYRR